MTLRGGRSAEWRELFEGRRGSLLAGLLLTEFAAAVQVFVTLQQLRPLRHQRPPCEACSPLRSIGRRLATLGAVPSERGVSLPRNCDGLESVQSRGRRGSENWWTVITRR